MAELEAPALLDQLTLVSSQSPDMTTIDIATTDGDVLLVLGETRLRVSSVILSSASPVFKAMLGQNFLEGQGERSSQSPKEVALLDDDADAMTRLCRLLHHQDSMPADPHHALSLATIAEELLNLMIVADKYCCTSSIRLAGRYMLFNSASLPIYRTTMMRTNLRLIAAAYMPEDARHFAVFTRRMVMDTSNPYSLIADTAELASLSSTLLCKFSFSQGRSK